MNIISFSGGADSTALLVYCRENNIPYEEVVYMEDWIPYPNKEFLEYFDYIEKQFDIKITRLKNDRKYWIKKNSGHQPRLPHPWCCRVKAEIFKIYVEEKYGNTGITIIMGVTKYESWKRAKYEVRGKWVYNKRFKVDYDYWLPVFKFHDTKTYCNIHGVKVNPLYYMLGVRRLGCWKCYKVGDLRWKPKDEQQLFLDEYLRNILIEDETGHRIITNIKQIKPFKNALLIDFI